MLAAYLNKEKTEAGCDEAGRGCLAGPVVAAAVILPKNFEHPLLNDSKQLTERQRYALRPIIEKEATAWAIGVVSPQEIDEINILNASFLAMHKALDKLDSSFDSILVDGNRFNPYMQKEHHCIVKGDGKYLSIAAASILAKTYRDDMMLELHKAFPEYGWNKNMGYPTQFHRTSIANHGITEHHRKSYKLLPTQLMLEFEF